MLKKERKIFLLLALFLIFALQSVSATEYKWSLYASCSPSHESALAAKLNSLPSNLKELLSGTPAQVAHKMATSSNTSPALMADRLLSSEADEISRLCTFSVYGITPKKEECSRIWFTSTDSYEVLSRSDSEIVFRFTLTAAAGFKDLKGGNSVSVSNRNVNVSGGSITNIDNNRVAKTSKITVKVTTPGISQIMVSYDGGGHSDFTIKKTDQIALPTDFRLSSDYKYFQTRNGNRIVYVEATATEGWYELTSSNIRLDWNRTNVVPPKFWNIESDSRNKKAKIYIELGRNVTYFEIELRDYYKTRSQRGHYELREEDISRSTTPETGNDGSGTGTSSTYSASFNIKVGDGSATTIPFGGHEKQVTLQLSLSTEDNETWYNNLPKTNVSFVTNEVGASIYSLTKYSDSPKKWDLILNVSKPGACKVNILRPDRSVAGSASFTLAPKHVLDCSFEQPVFYRTEKNEKKVSYIVKEESSFWVTPSELKPKFAINTSTNMHYGPDNNYLTQVSTEIVSREEKTFRVTATIDVPESSGRSEIIFWPIGDVSDLRGTKSFINNRSTFNNAVFKFSDKETALTTPKTVTSNKVQEDKKIRDTSKSKEVPLLVTKAYAIDSEWFEVKKENITIREVSALKTAETYVKKASLQKINTEPAKVLVNKVTCDQATKSVVIEFTVRLPCGFTVELHDNNNRLIGSKFFDINANGLVK